MTTSRERLLVALFWGPLARADAIVVLAGQDAQARLDSGVNLLRGQVAPWLVLTGAQVDGIGAAALHPKAMGAGVAPDAILVEPEATNTHEQAVNVVAMAREKGWTSLVLVASAYHLPRAFLAFVAAVEDDSIRIVPVPANGSWWTAPPGMTGARMELLEADLAKAALYADHVASYEAGLQHLQKWDGER